MRPAKIQATSLPATIDLLESDGKGGLEINGQTQLNVTVALVGVHVVGVIKDHPEFAWGTFEQIGNAPDLQAGIKDHPAIKSVFANYRLIGTAWIQANTLKPGDGNLDAETIGSIDLANSTLETYVQNVGTNCFSCHNTSAGKSYPGKDINLSHVILSVLPNNTKTLEANP